MNDIDIRIYNNVLDNGIAIAEKNNRGTYLGFVYAVEYGGMIKIGCTRNPRSRLVSLKGNAEKYGGIPLGRVCLIGPIYRHYIAERVAHEMFSESRKSGTELFDVPLDLFVKRATSLDIVFEYNKAEHDQQSESFVENIKKLLGWEDVDSDMAYVIRVLESKLEEEKQSIKKLESRNAELAYKSRYVDDLLTSKDTISMTTVALLLNFGFSRNKLQEILRNENILSERNIPNAEYIDNGWFSLSGKTVGVYQTGVYGILKLLKDKYNLKPIV